MTIIERLRDMEEETKRNKMRVDEYLGRSDSLIDETGVITMAGKPVAQVQIVQDENGKRVQLYNAKGVFLCERAYEGDKDTGLRIGDALFTGYMAGWENSQYSISKAVTKAMYERMDTAIY